MYFSLFDLKILYISFIKIYITFKVICLSIPYFYVKETNGSWSNRVIRIFRFTPYKTLFIRKTKFQVTTLKRNSSKKFPSINELKSFVENLDLIYHVAGVNQGTNEEIF